MMHFFHLRDLPVSRWRNGGGETREIVRFPAGQDTFGWRASIATISASGAFSRFPATDRVITLLQGDGVELEFDGKPPHALRVNQPFCFAGEESVYARLHGDASLDFNIMTARDSFSARVCVSGETQRAETGVAWVIAGQWRAAGRPLSAGQGAWWLQDGAAFIPHSADAQLLFASIIPRQAIG
ncbi:HutD family protein [Affinibrenneria salicis]|uniref:HutD family protein n=1 Tax=Affinibrenneria salicis TaxID=2590031 RepID=A0A5J5G1Q3_9GAMM|nr:HutD family protein [Affinibrenneria salicis]KAA9000676.1 HutD family protein [Affinibrenneria salicis]